MKTNKYIKKIIKGISKNIDINKINDIIFDACKVYDYLIKKYESDPKILKKQTISNMFPILATYKAMLANGFNMEEALKILDEYKTEVAKKNANTTSKLLKIFGLYRLYPRIFKKVTLKSFNQDIGFDPDFVIANKKQCKFNMRKCLFCNRLKEEEAFELVPVFCHTDIAFNENLHKNIIWKRESTLAEGAEYCDFDVSLRSNDDKRNR